MFLRFFGKKRKSNVREVPIVHLRVQGFQHAYPIHLSNVSFQHQVPFIESSSPPVLWGNIVGKCSGRQWASRALYNVGSGSDPYCFPTLPTKLNFSFEKKGIPGKFENSICGAMSPYAPPFWPQGMPRGHAFGAHAPHPTHNHHNNPKYTN